MPTSRLIGMDAKFVEAMERALAANTPQAAAPPLAVRYLDDPKLQISKIAWLLGFNEVSAFTHAFKRWTGKTPSQMRTTAVSSDFVLVG
jgi:AraC-like DNA-binding protein